MQQDVGTDFTDLKNEEERNNQEKSGQDSGDEDIEFNDGSRGGTTTEQPAEKTETKSTDSTIDGEEKPKENQVSYVEEAGNNTILRTNNSESMVENKWEGSTTSNKEQGSSQELGEQPKTDNMNLESKNHEPKKEIETENVGDGSQGRKEEY